VTSRRGTPPTVETTSIDGSHNKGGLGNGYVNLTRSAHVLLTGLHVRDVRHLSIQNSDATYPCRYNVLVHSQLEVDVNFHNGDAGHNLVQDCRIAVPTWHWWGPFAVGSAGPASAARTRQPGVPLRCHAGVSGPQSGTDAKRSCPTACTGFAITLKSPCRSWATSLPAPKAGTLVPVRAG
jgi:hypothetical protein